MLSEADYQKLDDILRDHRLQEENYQDRAKYIELLRLAVDVQKELGFLGVSS